MILVRADVVLIFTRCPQTINNIRPDAQGPASDWTDLRHAVVSAEWVTYPIGKVDVGYPGSGECRDEVTFFFFFFFLLSFY